ENDAHAPVAKDLEHAISAELTQVAGRIGRVEKPKGLFPRGCGRPGCLRVHLDLVPENTDDSLQAWIGRRGVLPKVSHAPGPLLLAIESVELRLAHFTLTQVGLDGRLLAILQRPGKQPSQSISIGTRRRGSHLGSSSVWDKIPTLSRLLILLLTENTG